MKSAARRPKPKLLLADLRQLIAEARQDVARQPRRGLENRTQIGYKRTQNGYE